MNLPTPLVSADWLRANLGADGLSVIDGTWFLDGGAARGRAAYNDAHIPGAVFFDIDAIADRETDLPHMLPDEATFAEAVGALGISNQDNIIVYDQQGLFSAPRVWWTFRAMGHEAVAVLNGGLPGWRTAGGLVTDAPTDVTEATFMATRKDALIAAADDIRKGGVRIMDARPSNRFCGEATEPRPGLIAGAMPGAQNTPAASLITGDGMLEGDEFLTRMLNPAETNDGGAIVTCGSGVTAAILGLALTKLGHRDWRLYDGSWAEWGRAENDRALFPVIANTESDRTDAEKN